MIVGSALGYYLVFLVTMATTSLWTDELYTILNYSGRGPLTTLTDYHEPNNHIFFNLLNSFIPGVSFNPLRARLWSFLAISALLVLVLVTFFSRGRFLCGALLFQLLAVNQEFLDLTLQARGYGLVSLFALLMSVATMRYLEQPKRSTLAWLGLCAILGGWTVPTFTLFAVPLLLLLALATRRREVLVTAALAGIGLIGVYLPVSGYVISHIQTFSDQWGREYASFAAVTRTLTTYLLHPSLFGQPSGDAPVVAFLLALALTAVILRERANPELIGARILLGSSTVFFLLCLGLQTPLIRSTAFIVVPLGISVVLFGAAALARVRPLGLRLIPAVVTTIFLVSHNLVQAKDFSLIPWEDWKGMAQLIAETFPEGMPLYVNAEPQFMAGYLKPGYRHREDIDPQLLIDGEAILIDSPVVELKEGRFNPTADVPAAVEFRLPQRRAGYQALWFVPPRVCLVRSLRSPDGGSLRSRLCGREFQTGDPAPAASPPVASASIRIDLQHGRRYRSVVLVTGDRELVPLAFRLHGPEGSPALEPGPTRQSRNLILVNLKDQHVSWVEVKLARGVESCCVLLRDVWAYAVD